MAVLSRLWQKINPGLCQGCGTCVALCRSKSIDIEGYTHETSVCRSYGIIKQERLCRSFEPKIIAFVCKLVYLCRGRPCRHKPYKIFTECENRPLPLHRSNRLFAFAESIRYRSRWSKLSRDAIQTIAIIHRAISMHDVAG